MRKIIIWIITVLITASSLTIVDGQAHSPVLEKLVESSDIIIQGVIIKKELVNFTIGSAELLYVIQVDSILKGEPTISHVFKGEYVRPGQSMTFEEFHTSIDVIYFLRHCIHYVGVFNTPKDLIVENCYEEGDQIIVFLEDNPSNVYANNLVDEWLGILDANSRLAGEIRILVKNHQ